MQWFQGYFEIYLQKTRDILDIWIFPKYLQLPGIEPAVLWLESQRTNHSANLPYYLLNLITPYLYCAATILNHVFHSPEYQML